MAQITPAKKSAIGPEYITPSIPINNGITISKGKRNIICLVRDRNVPIFGLPIDVKKFEVKTPDITIKVSPDRPDLIRTQIIDGQKYILIKADENVEVNGVNINITE